MTSHEHAQHAHGRHAERAKHMTPQRSKTRSDDLQPEPQEGQGGSDVSETVTREHNANLNQIRHEPLQASRHGQKRQEGEVQNERADPGPVQADQEDDAAPDR
jgi:hypothetical protein